jgi:hypothetical protein
MIALIAGCEVLIDAEDAFKVAEFGPWFSSKNSEDTKAGRFYFTHNLPEQNGKRECVRLHRVLIGANPGQIVDHINRNTLDCRKRNLRIADGHINAVNVTSTTTGVSWESKKKLYRARIQVNGKSIYIGRFKNKAKAEAAYREAETKYGYAEIRGKVTA